MNQLKPFKQRPWTAELGLEPEEALALLIMLKEMSPGMSISVFKEEIDYLQDSIASAEIEKMLKEEE